MKKMIHMLLVVALVLAQTTMVFATTQEVHDRPKNYDSAQVIVPNGDGSYTVMLEVSTNFGTGLMQNQTYQPPASPLTRYNRVEVFMSEDFDVLGAEAFISTPPASQSGLQIGATISEQAGKPFIRWDVDYGQPTTEYFSPPGLPISMPLIPINYLLIQVRPKFGKTGKLAPVDRAYQYANARGMDRREETRTEIFSNAMVIPELPKPELTVSFFEDPGLSLPITHTHVQKQPVTLRYTVHNPGTAPLEQLPWMQSMGIQNLQVLGGPVLASSLGPYTPIVLPSIAPGATLEMTAQMDLQAFMQTNSQLINYEVSVPGLYEHIDVGNFDDRMIVHSGNYIPFREQADFGNTTVQPRFTPERLLGGADPALAGIQFTYGLNRQVLQSGRAYALADLYWTVDQQAEYIPSPTLWSSPTTPAIQVTPQQPVQETVPAPQQQVAAVALPKTGAASLPLGLGMAIMMMGLLIMQGRRS